MNDDKPDARLPGTGQAGSSRTWWFPEAFDARSGEFSLVATTREILAAQNFLDGRWDRSAARHERKSPAAVRASLKPSAPNIRFIWHTGFCCSTLLAKALDRPGRNLSLCEPSILIDIADARRSGTLGEETRTTVPKLAFELLGHSGSAEEHVTVKPAPAANCLIRDAAHESSGQMLFLYSDCRSFVVSIAKMGEDGRKYARRLYLSIAGDGHMQAQWPPATIFSMSDLELAAVVWHMQIVEFHRHWPSLAPGRAASLNCDDLLAAPGEVLAKADSFLSLGLGADHLKQVAEGPLFRRNAKTGEESFDAVRRKEEYSRIEHMLGGDLDRIVERSYVSCRSASGGIPLPNPLLSAK